MKRLTELLKTRNTALWVKFPYSCLLLLLLLTKCSSGNSKMWLCQSFAPLQHSLALIPDGVMIQLKFLSVFSENLFSYFVNSSSDLCLFQINVGRRCFNFLMSSALYRRKQGGKRNQNQVHTITCAESKVNINFWFFSGDLHVVFTWSLFFIAFLLGLLVVCKKQCLRQHTSYLSFLLQGEDFGSHWKADNVNVLKIVKQSSIDKIRRIWMCTQQTVL